MRENRESFSLAAETCDCCDFRVAGGGREEKKLERKETEAINHANCIVTGAKTRLLCHMLVPMSEKKMLRSVARADRILIDFRIWWLKQQLIHGARQKKKKKKNKNSRGVSPVRNSRNRLINEQSPYLGASQALQSKWIGHGVGIGGGAGFFFSARRARTSDIMLFDWLLGPLHLLVANVSGERVVVRETKADPRDYHEEKVVFRFQSDFSEEAAPTSIQNLLERLQDDYRGAADGKLTGRCHSPAAGRQFFFFAGDLLLNKPRIGKGEDCNGIKENQCGGCCWCEVFFSFFLLACRFFFLFLSQGHTREPRPRKSSHNISRS